MPQFLRVLHLGTLAALVTLSGLTMAMPDAAAQSASDPDARVVGMDQRVFGSACPDGSGFVGEVIAPNPAFLLDGTWCRPDGFVPIQDQLLCEAVPGFAVWVDQGSLPAVCAWNGWSLTTAEPCPSPTVLAEGSEPASGRFGFWCLFPVLIEAADGGDATAGTPICIESSLVSEAAPTGAVGTSFNTGGRDYLIHTGPPTCETNCHDGFDFNCDDKLGDFCPVELNVATVAGTHDCIDGFAAAADEATQATPAVEAPVLAQVIPIATGGGPELAQTGSEAGLLAYLGLGLIGFGASALGLRRREQAHSTN